jgi:hypothetical protein
MDQATAAAQPYLDEVNRYITYIQWRTNQTVNRARHSVVGSPLPWQDEDEDERNDLFFDDVEADYHIESDGWTEVADGAKYIPQVSTLHPKMYVKLD